MLYVVAPDPVNPLDPPPQENGQVAPDPVTLLAPVLSSVVSPLLSDGKPSLMLIPPDRVSIPERKLKPSGIQLRFPQFSPSICRKPHF